MLKKIGILAMAALFTLTLFAPLSMAGTSGHSSQSRDMGSQGRDLDRNVYPKKSQDQDFNGFRYNRQLGDIGASTQPTHRGQEGSR